MGNHWLEFPHRSRRSWTYVLVVKGLAGAGLLTSNEFLPGRWKIFLLFLGPWDGGFFAGVPKKRD